MSIRNFLLLLLLSVMTLVSFSAAISGYKASVNKANALFDRNLIALAHSMVDIPHAQGAEVNLADSNIALQVWSGKHLVLKSLTAPAEPIREAGFGFEERNFSGQRWQTYCWQDARNARRIIVAEPLSERIELAEELALASLTPLIFATPLLALLIVLTISRGLSPLKQLSSMLMAREADDFSSLYLSKSPAELQPVVDTINMLFRRVAQAFEREKRFASDAAHELRTPLSVLQVGIHNLIAQHPDMLQELQHLQQGVRRMSHVIEQILLLNRTHPEHIKAKFMPLSLEKICQQVISDYYQDIEARKQTIELEADTFELPGDLFSLTTMIRNLVDNASKYTPKGGSILVSVCRQDNTAILSIEDSGPGIDKAERLRVMDRFYRVGGDSHPSGTPGCGLGMAIVSQVIDLHLGQLALDQSERLGGLKVRIELPISQEAAG